MILLIMPFYLKNKRQIIIQSPIFNIKNSLNNLFNNIFTDEIFFKFTNLIFRFSYKYNIAEVQYDIIFFDKNNNIIKPSDLSLFYKLHIICHINQNNDTLTTIDSLSNINGNEKYICIEYFSIGQKINFGINIYVEKYSKNRVIYFFSNDVFIYENLYINDRKFDPLFINKNYIKLVNSINKMENKSILNPNPLKLTKLYIKKPIISNKYDSLSKFSIWLFNNIYNNYYCLCKGACLYKNLPQKCKYLLYLNIIDNNKYLYNKTDFLLSDFYYSRCSSDDTYPIFVEMLKQNISAHYIDDKKDIYNKFCKYEKHCLKVIPLINRSVFINGDFLEYYLDLILRLKAVIAGESFYSFYNIFYNIDYITYINVGHGVKYFKQNSYIDYTSYKSFNKIMLPPSNKIISIAKKYGWKDDDIIKNCLPRWDKYNIFKQRLSKIPQKLKPKKSIFIMFTWRKLVKRNYNLKSFYLKNILNLLNDINLNKILLNNNITLFFTMHSIFRDYKKKIIINKNIKYINHNEVSKCLTESSLLISDFSSIIFDMIYQKKPFIMYIPDAYDPNIKDFYDKGYYDIINGLKNGSIYFENKFLSLNETINKIIFYINNDFKLESRLINFYNEFEFNCNDNTKTFINYLKNNI